MKAHRARVLSRAANHGTRSKFVDSAAIQNVRKSSMEFAAINSTGAEMTAVAELENCDVDPGMARRRSEWERVRPWIVEAIAKGPGFDTIDAVEQGISEGRLIFWAGPDSVVITRLDICPAKRIFSIIYAGGNIAAAIETGEQDLLRMAQLMDCDALLIEAPGEWAGVLEAKGFTPSYVTMMKPLKAPAAAVTA